MSAASESSKRGAFTSSFTDDELVVHGVAIGENDLTFGTGTETWKRWPKEALEPAARTLIGSHIVKNHDDRDIDDVIGQVKDVRYEDGIGVIFEGVITDGDTAEKVERGWLDVSPKIRIAEEEEQEDGTFTVKDIHSFANLGVVVQGAAPSNRIEPGESDMMMTAEELHEAFDYDDDETVEEVIESPVVEELILSEARTPEYEGTEEKSWGDIPADTLSHYTENLDVDGDSWEDLSEEERNEVASHTLLGDPDADSVDDGVFFPVVNASTGDLNRGALEAVRSGRGQSADIPSDTYESAFRKAGQLLNEEFDADVDVEMESEPESEAEEAEEAGEAEDSEEAASVEEAGGEEADESGDSEDGSSSEYSYLAEVKTTLENLRVGGPLGGSERSTSEVMTDEDILERLEAQAKLHDEPMEDLSLVPEAELEAYKTAEEKLSSEVDEKEDRIEELEDELESVEDEKEELEDEVETVKEIYAEALSEEHPADSDALAGRFDVAELREMYEDRVASEDGGAEELADSPDPNSGDETEEASEASELSEEEQEELAEIEARIDLLASKNSDLAETALEVAREEKQELLN